jgi:hypothetical protein
MSPLLWALLSFLTIHHEGGREGHEDRITKTALNLKKMFFPS